jgi:hypothetical protein
LCDHCMHIHIIICPTYVDVPLGQATQICVAQFEQVVLHVFECCAVAFFKTRVRDMSISSAHSAGVTLPSALENANLSNVDLKRRALHKHDLGCESIGGQSWRSLVPSCRECHGFSPSARNRLATHSSPNTHIHNHIFQFKPLFFYGCTCSNVRPKKQTIMYVVTLYNTYSIKNISYYSNDL